MARLVAGFALALLLALSSAAYAGDPSAAHSSVPAHINLVGNRIQNSFYVPDPMGDFQVIVRDAADAPVETNVYVFLNACGQTIPSSFQYGGLNDPCGSQMIVRQTDENGIARFNIVGATLHRQAAQPVPCASVYADGQASSIYLGSMSVAAFDEDGVRGVRGTDMRYWLCDYFSNPLGSSRSDFNGISQTNSVDLAMWVQNYFSQTSPLSGQRCDNLPTGTAAITPGQLYLSAVTGGKGSCAGSGGSATVTPDCASFTDLTRFTVSFKPTANIPYPVAFEAELELVGPAGLPFDDFWRIEQGGCNADALQPRETMGTVIGPLGCPFAFNCAGTQAYSIAYLKEYPYPGTNDIDRARIRVVGLASSPMCGTSMNANTKYTLFGLDLDPSITAGGCSGCTTPMALKLVSVMINQSNATWNCNLPAAPAASLERVTSTADDILVTSSTSDDSTVVFMNGIPAGYTVTGVGAGPVSAGTWLAPVQPNPCVSSARARYRLARAQQVSLAVFDLSGRRIQELDSGLREAGEHSATWDGHDHSGALAPGGIYFLRLRTPEGSFSRTVITRR